MMQNSSNIVTTAILNPYKIYQIHYRRESERVPFFVWDKRVILYTAVSSGFTNFTRMRNLIIGLFVLLAGTTMALAQKSVKKIPKSKLPYVERNIYINPKSGFVRGTLSFPKRRDTALVCLIIPGSGPTDRNGNNGNILITDSYKMLSDSLASRGFAVIRYDKRGIGESRDPDFSEFNLKFEDMVKDASRWIKDMKQNKRFSKVVVIGHSEGSLIGMLAADTTGADAFISLAGPARSADELILSQLKTQQLTIYEESERIVKRLKAGERVDTISPLLQAVFRPSVQNYLKSWFAYNPSEKIQNLQIPVLIVQGTTDIQVQTSEAHALKTAKSDAILLIINGMNHILKQAPEDRNLNIMTYYNKELPLHPELVPGIVDFLKKVESNPTIKKTP